jgi:hypothetical protein
MKQNNNKMREMANNYFRHKQRIRIIYEVALSLANTHTNLYKEMENFLRAPNEEFL